MANYRLMRYRQQFWGIFDCDETGRPKTLVPVFYHRDVRVARTEFERLKPTEIPSPNPSPLHEDGNIPPKASKKKG